MSSQGVSTAGLMVHAPSALTFISLVWDRDVGPPSGTRYAAFIPSSLLPTWLLTCIYRARYSAPCADVSFLIRSSTDAEIRIEPNASHLKLSRDVLLLIHKPLPACNQPTLSVRDLITALISVLSTSYSFNHVAYGRDFCAITFLDVTTQTFGILPVSKF